ncbi:hypothetical protein [Cellulomonas sp. KRMCY2]|uniref:hypothetical protein n=1 Tax=Cellulomonas sp. KRMCY2 TaxID=1304865 RepID=UPI00045EB838|nr:hypothetical protein [Cellulomonas sp. KRMCY2]
MDLDTSATTPASDPTSEQARADLREPFARLVTVADLAGRFGCAQSTIRAATRGPRPWVPAPDYIAGRTGFWLPEAVAGIVRPRPGRPRRVVVEAVEADQPAKVIPEAVAPMSALAGAFAGRS